MVPKLLVCPCCDAPVSAWMRRTEPVDEAEFCGAYRILVTVRGWTADRLLTEADEALDILLPGFTDWLRQLPADSH